MEIREIIVAVANAGCLLMAGLAVAAGVCFLRERSGFGRFAQLFNIQCSAANSQCFGRVVWVLMVAGFVVFGGGKGRGRVREGGRLGVEDFERGVVVGRVGTGEVWDFGMFDGAVEKREWRLRGAAEDWFEIGFGDWEMWWGEEAIRKFRVRSGGVVEGLKDGGGVLKLCPMKGSLGIVPEARWEGVGGTNFASRFWHGFSGDGSLVMTWENALWGRERGKPASFQVVANPLGRVEYRYDLGRGGLGEGWETNVWIGVENDGKGDWLEWGGGTIRRKIKPLNSRNSTELLVRRRTELWRGDRMVAQPLALTSCVNINRDNLVC